MNIRGVKAIKVMPIVGVRPQIIKSAPVLRLLRARAKPQTTIGRYILWFDLKLRKTLLSTFVKKIISILMGGAFVIAYYTGNESSRQIMLK